MQVIRLYFAGPDDGGHGYTLGRVPINSCDFSPGSYSFDDVSGDTELEHFDTSVQHDVDVGMIPMMLDAKAAVEARGYRLNIYASPWSPPAPFVGGAAAFGHADPLGCPRGQDMATGLPPLGVPSPGGASGTSCSPWWQSGGNLSLGGLPAPALADWGGFGLTPGGAVDDDSKRRVGLGATGSA